MNPMDVLTAVNSFYDQSFNKLLIVTFGLMAFIGVFVPLAVGWVQLRTLRSEKSSLIGELRTEINSEREAIESRIASLVDERFGQMKAAYEERFTELSSNLKKASSAAEARAFHLQGTMNKKSEYPHLGIADFCYAAPLYISAGDEANAQRCMNSLESCLKKTNSDKYEELNVESKCNKLIEQLEEANEGGRYANYIEKIRQEMNKSKQRTATPKIAAGSS